MAAGPAEGGGAPSTRGLRHVQDQLVAHVKKALGLRTLMVAAPQPGLHALFRGGGNGGGGKKLLSSLALCAGSGSSLLDRALQSGADVFLTGAHHTAVCY